MEVVAKECIVFVDLTKVFWYLPCIMQVVPHDWKLLDIDWFDLVKHLRWRKIVKHGEVLT
jgi:hypothetical protein